MAEIASAIGNGASSALGEEVELARIQKRPREIIEDAIGVLYVRESDSVMTMKETPAKIMKRPREINEDEIGVLDVPEAAKSEVARNDPSTTTRLHTFIHQSQISPVQTRITNSKIGVDKKYVCDPIIRTASAELTNSAKEIMGSLAKNIMEGGVGMFEALIEKQLAVHAQQLNSIAGSSGGGSTTTTVEVLETSQS